MAKQIIIINGSGGVGKDTFVKTVSQFIHTINYSSVDKIKEIAREVGWNGRKTEKDRKFLSDLKSLCNQYNNLSMKYMGKIVQEFHESDYYQLLFLHIREPEEISVAAKLFNAKTLLIRRDSIDVITTNKSDASVFDYEYDYIIDNDGTKEELKSKAIDFLQCLDAFNK